MKKSNRRIYYSVGTILIVSLLYLAFNIFFNRTIWQQVLYPEKLDQIIVQGESPIYEYVAETVRNNILTGNNPFKPIDSLLYPFGWHFALEDVAPINGFFFLFLRPFLSIHQSMMLLIVINIFLSNAIMYLFLRYLKIRKDVAFLGGFLFGFTPWVALRIGAYPSYTAVYLFPLVTYFLTSLFYEKKHKVLRATLLAVVSVVTLLTNLYFTVMLAVLGMVSFVMYIIFYRELLFSFLKTNIRYLLITGIVSLVLLFPWLLELYNSKLFIQYPNPPSLVDSVAFSADIFNIILPSYSNPFYSSFLRFFLNIFPYSRRGIFESFIYPGIIIFIGYLTLFYYWKGLKKDIKVLMLLSLCMLVLTFGPFLQIYGSITKIPLPFLLLKYIPYFEMARAPGRFIIIFIFLATIVICLNFSKILNSVPRKSQLIIFFAVLLIAIIDQSYVGNPPLVFKIPNKIFAYIKNRPESFSVLNIPFTIRDGLQSLGDYHGVWFPRTQLIAGKPFFSIYAGRISENTFQYYKRNSLFSLFDRVINSENTDYISLFNSADIKLIDRTITFLDTDYILLNSKEKYYIFAKEFLQKLRFKEVLADNSYVLMYRKNNQEDFFPETINLPEDELFFGQGWDAIQNDGRWITGNVSSTLFKIKKPKNLYLSFRAKSVEDPQKISVYINKKYLQDFILTSGYKDYNLELNSNIKSGINTITFQYPHFAQPSRVLPNNNDQRRLSAYFASLNISDKKNNPRKITENDDSITFDNPDDELQLSEGWSNYEKGSRWIEGKTAKVEFNIRNKNPKKLVFTAEALYKPQITKIYVNDNYIGTLKIDSGKINSYSLDINNSLKNGSNIITFQFSHAERIGTLTNIDDIRVLSTSMKSIKLL